MSNYVKTTDFASKDLLASGNPAKAVKGVDLGLEFDAIAAMSATKLDTAASANPTGVVGLAAVNGTAATYLRSDGAPALSQAIVPTWTGIHTFSAIPVLNAGASIIDIVAGTLFDVGFRDQPVNTVSGGYTLVMSDRGKIIRDTAGNITIPANATVAYPNGTTISIYNNTGAPITISITTDTLILAAAGTTGSRTLSNNGLATIVKVTGTAWVISGAGVS